MLPCKIVFRLAAAENGIVRNGQARDSLKKRPVLLKPKNTLLKRTAVIQTQRFPFVIIQ
jgi:hypothetical protein